MNHIPCGVVLSTFHIMPEQSLRFWVAKLESNQLPTFPKKVALPDELFARTYQDVLLLLLHILLGYKIQHTSCLLPCELLNHTSRIRSKCLPSSFVLLSCLSLPGQTQQLPVNIQQSQCWFALAWVPPHLATHRFGSVTYPFGPSTITYCLPPFYWRTLSGLFRLV
jgi:hypothetical protein